MAVSSNPISRNIFGRNKEFLEVGKKSIYAEKGEKEMNEQPKEENYCVKFLNGFGAGAIIGSATRDKFATELKKLHADGLCLIIEKGKKVHAGVHAENLRRQTTDFDNFINAIFKKRKK